MINIRTVRFALIDLKDWFAYHHMALASLVAPALISLALGAALLRVLQQPPVEQPVIVLATPALPTAQPTAEPIQVAAVHYVTAYDAPGGNPMGPIPVPPISAVVARWGDSWLLVPWDGSNVWVLAADVGLPNVADLEPPPAPVVIERPIYVSAPAPAVATPEPVYQITSSEPPAAPAAAPAVVRAEDFQDPNRAATCAFVGCLPGR